MVIFKTPPIIRLVLFSNRKIDVIFKSVLIPTLQSNGPIKISLYATSVILGMIKQASRAKTRTG